MSKDKLIAEHRGACDFCYQKNVPVLPLHCNRHFFCLVCEKFAPKFKRKDYKCMRCSERARKIQKQNSRKVDRLFGSHSKSKTDFTAIALDGEKILTLDDESDDDADLKGNNEEWDRLLEELTNDPPTPRKQARKYGKAPTQKSYSFLKLVLPSTDDEYSPGLYTQRTRSSSSSASEPRDLTSRDVRVTPELHVKNNSHSQPNLSEVLNSVSPVVRLNVKDTCIEENKCVQNLGAMGGIVESTVNQREEELGEAQLERGTSPDKGRRRCQKRWRELNYPKTDGSDSDDEMEFNPVGEFEGPSHFCESDPGVEVEVMSNHSDDFWNF